MSNLATFNQALASEKTKAMVVTALKDKANDYFSNIASLVANDPKLQVCDPVTLICGGLQSASLALPLNKNLGFAWLIPYKNHGKDEAQFQLGAKGMLQLAMRSGQFKCINVDCVYEGELSKNNKKTGEIEFDGERKSDKVVGYFAYMELVNGFQKTLYMTVDDIRKHGQRFSKTFSSGPWQTDFDAMAKKTVLKSLLSKYAPMSVEMSKALTADQAVIRENSVIDYVDSTIDEQEQPEPQQEQQVKKVMEKAQKAKAMAQAAKTKAIEPNEGFDNDDLPEEAPMPTEDDILIMDNGEE